MNQEYINLRRIRLTKIPREARDSLLDKFCAFFPFWNLKSKKKITFKLVARFTCTLVD